MVATAGHRKAVKTVLPAQEGTAAEIAPWPVLRCRLEPPSPYPHVTGLHRARPLKDVAAALRPRVALLEPSASSLHTAPLRGRDRAPAAPLAVLKAVGPQARTGPGHSDHLWALQGDKTGSLPTGGDYVDTHRIQGMALTLGLTTAHSSLAHTQHKPHWEGQWGPQCWGAEVGRSALTICVLEGSEWGPSAWRSPSPPGHSHSRPSPGRSSGKSRQIASCPPLAPPSLLLAERGFQKLVELWDFPGGLVVKNPPANAGDMGSIPGSGRPQVTWSS